MAINPPTKSKTVTQKQSMEKMNEKRNSDAGNRTPSCCVRDSDVSHYTTSDFVGNVWYRADYIGLKGFMVWFEWGRFQLGGVGREVRVFVCVMVRWGFVWRLEGWVVGAGIDNFF